MSEEAGGLRARRRALMEAEVEAAAIEAFEAQGFAATTMEQIAVRAGVSLRTAFRYFPTKVDTVLYSARQVGQALGQGLRSEIDAQASLSEIEESIAGSLAALATASPDTLARLKRVYALTLEDGLLRAQVTASADYLAGLEGHDAGVTHRTLETRLLASIVAATLRVAFDEWAASDDGVAALADRYRQARETRASLLQK